MTKNLLKFESQPQLERPLSDPQLQFLSDKITEMKMNAPVVFLLESIFPLRQTAYCCSEFFAPVVELFFQNGFQLIQKLFSDSESYQNFLDDLEHQTRPQRDIY